MPNPGFLVVTEADKTCGNLGGRTLLLKEISRRFLYHELELFRYGIFINRAASFEFGRVATVLVFSAHRGAASCAACRLIVQPPREKTPAVRAHIEI